MTTDRRTIRLRDAVLALLGMTVAFALVIATIVVMDDREDREKARDDVDQAFVGCLRYNDTRLLIRSVVLDAYGDGSQEPIDLTLIPAYNGIDDPDVQSLIARLVAPSDDGNSRRDTSLARTATRDCEKEFPTHTRGLTLEPAAPLIPPPEITTTTTVTP